MTKDAVIYCSACGAGNHAQAIYCFYCGQKMLIGTPPGIMQTDMTTPGAPASATGHLTAQQLLYQRYVIVELLGQGGMGAVYKALDTQFGHRTVAIKEMSQSRLDEQEAAEAAEQFKHEALLLAGLQHPGLPSIYDHFTENGRWYLVMDFIAGETLEEYITRFAKGRLTLAEVIVLSIELTRVLGYLHSQQPPIVFRDLKPLNVMITPDKHVYLIDFGIARFFKPGEVKDTTPYGSLGYAAPEQYGKGQTSPRSDIYALGAVMHQLLSGNDPATNIPVFRFQRLHVYNATLPIEITTLIMRMIDADAGKRPASMTDVRKELEQMQQQQVTPHVLSPVDPSPRSPKPVTYASSISWLDDEEKATRRRLLMQSGQAGTDLRTGVAASRPSPLLPEFMESSNTNYFLVMVSLFGLAVGLFSLLCNFFISSVPCAWGFLVLLFNFIAGVLVGTDLEEGERWRGSYVGVIAALVWGVSALVTGMMGFWLTIAMMFLMMLFGGMASFVGAVITRGKKMA